MKQTHKEIVRAFIVEKIRETTTLALFELAEKYGVCDHFSIAECFDNEAYRVEKLFYFPEFPQPSPQHGIDEQDF